MNLNFSKKYLSEYQRSCVQETILQVISKDQQLVTQVQSFNIIWQNK